MQLRLTLVQYDRRQALAAGITAKTFVFHKAREIASAEIEGFTLASHAGLQSGRLLVKRLGLRGDMQNEVWAGRPVNVAAKLASRAGPDQLLVSGSVFDRFTPERIRTSCGCAWHGTELVEAEEKSDLWKPIAVDKVVFGFEQAYVLASDWCPNHGQETCEAILQL